MIIFLEGLVAADPPPDYNGLKCSLGTRFCTICYNRQRI